MREPESNPPAPLGDVLLTEELARRPGRAPDFEGESRALRALADAMAVSPEEVLLRLAEAALSLCRADSAGVSLLESGDGAEAIRWHATAGQLAPYRGEKWPRGRSPCGTVLERGTPLLIGHPERHFQALEPIRPPMAENLLVPFNAGERPVGTVWVASHGPGPRFDAEDARLLMSLSRCASVAYRLTAALEAAAGRERSAREARESEERFRLLVQSATDFAILLLDPAGNVASWNEGAERILGYQADEVLGRSSALFFTEEDRRSGMLERELRAALTEGRATDENWSVRKDGARFWASGVTTPLWHDGGGHRGFVKIFRDLTERKAAEDALREKDLRLRAALAAARMGTWHWDIPADRHSRDENLQRLLGLPPAGTREDTLEGFLRAVHPDDRDHVREGFRRSVVEGAPLNVEFRVPQGDGSVRWLRDQGDVFPGPDGRPLYLTGACVDITERRRMEEALRDAHAGLERRVEERTAELRDAQRRALQAERLAAVGQVMAGLAHESRNALQRGQACLSLLALRLASRPEELDLVARAQRAQDDLHRLYEDAQGYAAPLTLDWQPCDLRAIAREAWDDLAQAWAGRPVTLREEGGADARCDGSPFHLRQLFRNLLDNALAASPPGPAEVVVAFADASPGGRAAVRVEVKDAGPGFPAGGAAGAFEPFFTTKVRGTGLGLTICARIVEAHGGTITAREGGPGGLVFVTLPRRRA